MKKTFVLLLIIITLLFMTIYVYADDNILDSGSCGDNLTWTLDNNGFLDIEGSGTTDTYGVGGATAPWYSYKDIIKTIQIGSNVTSIDAYAFRGLKYLETIKWNAIDCKIVIGLNEGHLFSFDIETDDLNAIFGVGVKKIPTGIFESCTKLKYVTISNTVTEIGSGAFRYCSNLSNVSIPASVTTIENAAFVECTLFTNMVIPDTVISMGSSVFEGCKNLSHVYLGKGLKRIEKWTFKNCISLEEIEIFDNVTDLCYESFLNCQSLRKIKIASNIKNIENRAFYNCNNLSEVYYKGINWNKVSIGSGNSRLTNAKFTYIPYTKTIYSTDSKQFIVSPNNIDNGKIIILALYNDKNVVEIQKEVYTGDKIRFSTTKAYTVAKVFVWNNLTDLIPVCENEVVK